MKIPAIDQAIQTCKDHLDKTGSRGTQIESYLTQYLLVLISAAFEEKVEEILLKRADKITDVQVKSFFKNCVHRIFRSAKSSELAGMLGYFDRSVQATFGKAVNGTREESSYNSIIVNRHDTAHSKGSTISFSDLERYYQEGHVVLDHFSAALGV